MKRAVYIETTIPSFYYEVRDEPLMVARRDSTRQWWNQEGANYDLHVSAFVLGELEAGDYPGKTDAIALIERLPVLEAVPEVGEIAEVYIAHGLMPREYQGDAFHLHLANANKARHVRVINTRLGLHVPIITTPDLLVRQENSDV